jgi:hypothetical protein
MGGSPSSTRSENSPRSSREDTQERRSRGRWERPAHASTGRPGERQVGPVAGRFRLPALIVIPILRSGRLTAEGLARNLGMPVHERAVGIVLPCPDVQRVEGRKPEAVRALEQV